MNDSVVLDGRSLTLAHVEAVARGNASVSLSDDARARMLRAHEHVDRIARDREVVYGVTTGFGRLKDRSIDRAELRALQLNLLRSHAAGVGPPAPRDVVRAMLLLRAASLATGHSGVRPEVVESLLALLAADVTPVVTAKAAAP